MSSTQGSVRPQPDPALTDIADYVCGYEITSAEAYRMARFCLLDALGCAVEALNFPECAKLLGPMVPGIVFAHGARVPGTRFELDPISAAFNIGTMIRWLDLNDSFTAADGGHPSDNLGAILATAEYLSRKRVTEGASPLLMRDVLTALIKVYEIQGMLSLENDLARLGFDFLTFAKVAATAVVTQMLSGSRAEVINAVSNAWADGVNLKVYRRGANTGPRKGWSAGDCASRAVRLAMMALTGEMGYPSVLTAKTHGFHDAIFKGQPLKFQLPYGHYVVEHILFKFIAAGMYGQSAVECAFRLHPLVKGRLDDIAAVTIKSQKALMRAMDKQGPLTNAADRDLCAQYVIAVGLIHGKLSTSDSSDEFAADARIDLLRAKMTVVEEPRYTQDFHDPNKRSSANAIELRFRDGSSAPKVEVEYPLGHPIRRAEAIPKLEEKFNRHIARRFPSKQQAAIFELCLNQSRLESIPVHQFMEQFVI